MSCGSSGGCSSLRDDFGDVAADACENKQERDPSVRLSVRMTHEEKPRQPSLDGKELAQLLGMFGQSELATSILALSLAATQGNIDVTPELEEKIDCACEDIQTIKQALILALGIKPQGTDCR